ncbi:hypothetical protein GCM10023205_46120 [Yinghuangia aomiensis]|uniref:Uncharacterized protein n=2 Tax=Yinghuangia aomiensis TaxID=676205 RepID=A0ABP9HMQ8_9ACTN
MAGVLMACDSFGSSSDAEAEEAAHRCAPLSSDASDLAARVRPMGPAVSATWCIRALGTPGTSRVSVPGPHDWVFYGVVRLADPATADAWGPWQPNGAPELLEMPAALRSLVPAPAQWSSNGAGAYLDRASATLLLDGVSA